MSHGEWFVLVLTLCLSVVIAGWVGVLTFGGVKLAPACRYLVPVVGHAHVLTCSYKPRPERIP